MKVAILKGGKYRHQESLDSAKNIFNDIKNHANVDDVYIDKHNVWHHKGIKSEPHFVLAHCDYVIDTTHDKSHAKLVRDLSVKNILDHEPHLHNYRKVLHQANIKVPSYKIFKKLEDIQNQMYNLWREMHMPIVVKGSHRISPKLIAHSPNEIIEHASSIFQKGEDVILESFIRGRHYHIITASNIRKQNVYKSILLESLQNRNGKEYIRAMSLNEKRKQELEKVSELVHKLLDLKIARLDFVMNSRGHFYLVNMQNKLSLRDGGINEALFKSNGLSLSELF